MYFAYMCKCFSNVFLLYVNGYEYTVYEDDYAYMCTYVNVNVFIFYLYVNFFLCNTFVTLIER